MPRRGGRRFVDDDGRVVVEPSSSAGRAADAEGRDPAGDGADSRDDRERTAPTVATAVFTWKRAGGPPLLH